MKVAVIGASGGMGSFFVRYFLDRGETVVGSDAGGAPKKSGPAGIRLLRTNEEAVRGCDVAIVAVPMDATLEAAKGVVGKMKAGSTLVEISSVKGETLKALRELVGAKVTLLSIHPLFGPALESRKGMKIAVVLGKRGDQEKESAMARRLFPDARIIAMTRKEHDRAMAVVLSLTHMMNMVYAGTVAKFLSPEEFMRVSTPNSSMQLALAEAVLAQDARLSYAIQARNPYSRKVARAAAKELGRVLKLIEGGDPGPFDEHFQSLSKRYKIDRRAAAAIREIYSAAEKAD